MPKKNKETHLLLRSISPLYDPQTQSLHKHDPINPVELRCVWFPILIAQTDIHINNPTQMDWVEIASKCVPSKKPNALNKI